MIGIALVSQSWLRFGGNQVRILETETAKGGRAGAVFIHERDGVGPILEPTIQKLQATLKCVSLELPGLQHLSLIQSASLVETALGERKFRPLILVGHGFGAAVAQAAALRLGERVSGAVLIQPRAISDPPGKKRDPSLWPGLYERLAWKRQLEQLQLPTLVLENPDSDPILHFVAELQEPRESNVRRFPLR